MPVDKFGRMSDSKTRDTGVSLTYINNNYIRSDGGTPVTGSIDMRGNTLRNVAEPVKQNDVATKDYADYIKASNQDYVDYKISDFNAIRKNIIMVIGTHSGPLKHDRFQFFLDVMIIIKGLLSHGRV